MPTENGAAAVAAAQTTEAPVDSGAQQGQSQPAGGSGTTYTAEELNAHTDRVVKERIDRQNAKHSKAMATVTAERDDALAEIEKLKEQLAAHEEARSRSELIAKVAADTGLAEQQVSLLSGTTEEDLIAAANALKDSMPSLYPSVNEGGTPAAPVTKDDIRAIKNVEERIAAQGRNKELFR